MKVRSAFLGAICLLAATAMVGQNGPDSDPDGAQGYVNNVFHTGQIDSINLYNGQLTVPLPLGPAYSIGPKLKFQARLTYNSRVQDYGHPSTQFTDWTVRPMTGDPALGVGWGFSIGAIKQCYVGQQTGPVFYPCFIGSDGGQHIFDLGSKSADGSQFLLQGTGPYQMWDGDGNRYDFNWQVSGFDDAINGAIPGYVRDFGRGRDGWYATSVTDPFGNLFTVDYFDTALDGIIFPCWTYGDSNCTTGNWPTHMLCSPPGKTKTWIPKKISLPAGAHIDVHLNASTQVWKIDFPVFAGGSSTTATWAITYDSVGSSWVCGQSSVLSQMNVRRLKRIDFPAGVGGAPFYAFDYGAYLSSLLTHIDLPTGGTLDYCWSGYAFFRGRISGMEPGCGQAAPPAPGANEDVHIWIAGLVACGGPSPPPPGGAPPPIPGGCTGTAEIRWLDFQTGVTRRTETTPGGTPATTKYTQYSFPFGERGSGPPGTGSQTLTVVVSPPDLAGHVSARAVLFQSAPKTQGSNLLPTSDRTGADIEERIFDHDPNWTGSEFPPPPMPACGGANLSFCSNNAVRVTKRTFEYDDAALDRGDRRVNSETTFYSAAAVDGTCASCPSHSVAFTLNSTCGSTHDQPCTWDAGNGRHYNKEDHTGNILTNVNRSISSVWFPANWAGTPAGTVLPNILLRRTVTEPSSTFSVDRYFEFDASGFQTCSLLYDPIRARLVFNRRFRAGDGTLSQEFTASAPYGTPPYGVCTLAYGSPPIPSGPQMGSNDDAFGKTYTFQSGLLTSERWISVNSAALWYSKRYDRNPSTGWVTNSYDSAGLATSYVYDVLGRVTSVTAPGEAATTVTYPSAVQTTASRNGGAGLLTFQEYDYDGLGRLRREIRSMPSSSYAVRTHAFDGPGHPYFDSEWAACSSPSGNCQTAAPGGTTSSNFDPFGRAQNVVRADGATTTVSFADPYSSFSDTKKTVTTKNVGGTCSGGTCSGGADSTTVFVSDAFGRLTSVTEPGGDLTNYGYDLNGKLTSVAQGVQSRSFVYDPNGFLMQENTPEKGVVNYDCYGSLGNVVLQTPPGVQLANNYDFAARVIETRSTEIGPPAFTNPCVGQALPSGGRRYVSNTYNNSTAGNSFGRLTSRVGSSFFTPLGAASDVTDSFVYNGVGARVSSETTTVAGSGVSTTQSWMYNGLGLLAHHYHARSSGAPFVLSWGYDAGLPVKGYVNGIPMVKTVTYAPSGALTAYTTGLGIGTDVTTAIAQDAQLLPRPASITTSGATLNFATGAYSYDGAGNIKAMGAVDSFDYDLRSRLLSATLSNPQGGTVSQSMGYDRYGNLLTKGATTYSVNATNNRLTTATYDARGNVTVNGGDTYAYDALDRMEYNRTASSEWDYVYDAEGERIAKVPPFGAPWTHTFRDEGKRVSTEYAGTTPSRDNVYLGSLLVASYANGSVGGNGSVWTYYASDHLGTPRLITDPGGTVVEQRKTFPYGEDLGTQGIFQRVRFVTMERDVEGASSGSGGSRHHDHARSQEFNLGRFLSADRVAGNPRVPQTWNRYAYALNNPLIVVDQNGLWPTKIHNEIIQRAFPGLSPTQQQALMRASFSMDHRAGAQQAAMSYTHAMRAPLQTVDDAQAKAVGFYGEKVTEAAKIQAAAEQRGSTTITLAALFSLGEALHTVSDATSPEHEGFKIWRGTSIFDALSIGSHIEGERWISPERMDMAVAMLQAAYAEAFGMERLKEASTVPLQGPCPQGKTNCLN